MVSLYITLAKALDAINEMLRMGRYIFSICKQVHGLWNTTRYYLIVVPLAAGHD